MSEVITSQGTGRLTPKQKNSISSFIWSKKTLSFRIFLAGGLSGAISRTVTAPLDRIKLLMQASYGTNALNIASSTRKIYADSGIIGFWRGNGVNCLKIFPETALLFYIYEVLRASFNIDTNHADLFTRFLTGSIAGLMSQTIIYPLEVVKTRVALSVSGMYANMWDVVRKTVQMQGMGGLYKGLLASMLGVIPYSGVELMVYSYLTDRYGIDGHHKGVVTVLFSGAISSLCGQTVSYPFQLVRTKLQAQGMPTPKGMEGKVQYRVYNGVVDCMTKIVKNRGIAGLYRGICANYMKAIPAISVKYMMYELLKEWFRVGDKLTST